MPFSIPLSFDPIACILGAVAVVLAWAAYRSSTYHNVRIEDLKATFIDSVRDDECGPSFAVTILNCGLPIHDLDVSLFFVTDSDHPMQLSLSMKPLYSIEGVAFDKGMRCVFVLRPLHDRNLE